MTWQKELIDLPSDEGGTVIERMHPTDQDKLFVFISYQMEKLINEIPDDALPNATEVHNEIKHPYLDIKPLKAKLRNKYLTK